MSIIIRKARADDERQVVDLWQACNLTVDYNDPLTDYHFALRGDSSTVLVAENESSVIVGSIMVGHDGHRGWMYYLAAAPHAQGTGIGRAMVSAGEDWLKQHQVRKVQLMFALRTRQ